MKLNDQVIVDNKIGKTIQNLADEIKREIKNLYEIRIKIYRWTNAFR